MGGRIAALALGRRSRWVVIVAWLVAGGRARAAAAEAPDDRLRRERDVPHPRGGLHAGPPPARHALPRERRFDRGDRVRDHRGVDLHAHAGDRRGHAGDLRSRDAAGAQGRRRARRSGLRRDRARARPRDPADGVLRRRSRRAWCCSRSSTAATTRSRWPRTWPRSARLLPGPDGSPLRSYVTGEAGFDADRSARRRRARRHAAGDHRRAGADPDADRPTARR